MRRGLVALSACLLAAAAAPGQQAPGPYPTVPAPAATPAPTAPGESYFNLGCGPGGCGAGTPFDAVSGPARRGWTLYGGADYLVWYVTPMNTPDLIQVVPQAAAAGGQAQLPAGTAGRFFPDRRDVRFGMFDGVRLTAGVGYNDWGFEATGYYLDRNTEGAALATNGSPFAVAQPYNNVANGTQITLYSSLAGQYAGGIGATVDSRQWGLEGNVRIPWYALFTDWTDLLLGFRYAELEEGIAIQATSLFPNGTTLTVSDSIRTTNRFYGPQIGFHGRIGATGRGFGVEVLTKLALGGVQQTATLTGSNTYTFVGAGSDTQAGGLYARGQNFGTFRRGHFAALPELNVNLTYNLNSGVQFYVGYSLMWISSVMRPGEAIDTSLNEGAVRFIANPTQATVSRPVFQWNANELWTQGVNFGVKFRY